MCKIYEIFYQLRVELLLKCCLKSLKMSFISNYENLTLGLPWIFCPDHGVRDLSTPPPPPSSKSGLAKLTLAIWYSIVAIVRFSEEVLHTKYQYSDVSRTIDLNQYNLYCSAVSIFSCVLSNNFALVDLGAAERHLRVKLEGGRIRSEVGGFLTASLC